MCFQRRFIFLLGFSALVGAAHWDRAHAVEASGTTIAVIPSAAAAGVTGRRILKIQGSVFSGDVVETGAVGEVQIEFRDQTKLVVGAHSKLIIDSFVFDDRNTARKVSMKAVKGAFRFITGVSKKQAYAIATPSATIGIRGTRFDFSVRPDGETSFALYEGEARVCDRTGQCREVRGSCEVVVASPRGGVAPVAPGAERTARLRALFPYAISQARLQPQFRVNTSGCHTRQAALPQREPLPIEAAPVGAAPPQNPPGTPPTLRLRQRPASPTIPAMANRLATPAINLATLPARAATARTKARATRKARQDWSGSFCSEGTVRFAWSWF